MYTVDRMKLMLMGGGRSDGQMRFMYRTETRCCLTCCQNRIPIALYIILTHKTTCTKPVIYRNSAA